MLKKLISITLVITMFLSLSAVSFAANAFSDVSEEDYSWAVSQISEMADKGIITGYPDGTFKPDKGITKVEAMLLISRILGIKNDVYSDKLEDIYDIYEDDLEDLDLQYKNEVAFLIYKGVFSLDEILDIADNDEFNEPLLRYEAAEYLAKVLGGEVDLSDDDTGYEDENKIPAGKRAFVKYVKDKNIMQGMSETTFEPSFQVNRAQMAVMLYRVMGLSELLFIEGKYDRIRNDEITVELESGDGDYDVSDAVFYLNGEEIEIDELKEGVDVVLVFEDTTLKRVEAIYFEPEVHTLVLGEIKEIVLTSVKTVKIDNSQTGEVEIYSVLPTCEVYVDGSYATLSVLRTKDNAKLYLDEDNSVFKIDVLDATDEFTDGVIKELSIDERKVVIQRKNGIIETYFVSDEIAVIRNGKDSSLANLIVGDKISKVIVRYNKIGKLQVTSEIGSLSGTISEILIAKQSSIVVTKDGDDERYPLTNSIKVFLDDKECEIYDLRLDMTAKITTDSGAVSEIRVSTVEEVSQISGVVEVVNPSYGFINVKTANGESKQIFVSSSTKITADGAVTATKTIKNIYVDDYVVVIGRMVNGAFQASTIVIVQ
ncbi:MAG: S-layer homology domain-containing protein [Ruminococcaceae bacterium]|nr:S-layer homology domain-containing protein [Oscillospiraceae bacterium]